MTVIINKKLSQKEVAQTLENITKQTKQKGLRKHFGLSDKKIDALEFQKKDRNEWD